MVADIVEVIFIDHISNFVQLNARFLRVNFGFPADVDHDDAFVCGVANENDGYWNVAGCTEKNWNRLKRKLIHFIKLMRRNHTHDGKFPFQT
jgi:hypothetical protein